MSLVTVTLRPVQSLSVALTVGGQAALAVADERLSVLLAARQVIVGPPGVAGITRAMSVVSTPELAIPADAYDMANVTAQDEPLYIPNPTGSPTQGQRLMITVKDNGVAPQGFTFGTQFRGAVAALPATTMLGKTTYMGFMFNAFDVKWELMALANQL